MQIKLLSLLEVVLCMCYVNNSDINRMCFLKFQGVMVLSSEFNSHSFCHRGGKCQRQLSTFGLSTMLTWGFCYEVVMMDRWSLIFYHKYLVRQGDTGVSVSSAMYETYIGVFQKPGL